MGSKGKGYQRLIEPLGVWFALFSGIGIGYICYRFLDALGCHFLLAAILAVLICAAWVINLSLLADGICGLMLGSPQVEEPPDRRKRLTGLVFFWLALLTMPVVLALPWAIRLVFLRG